MISHEQSDPGWIDDFVAWESELPGPLSRPNVNVMRELIRAERLDLDSAFEALKAQMNRLGIEPGRVIAHRLPLEDGHVSMYATYNVPTARDGVRIVCNRLELDPGDFSRRRFTAYDYFVVPDAKVISVGYGTAYFKDRIHSSQLPPCTPPLIGRSHGHLDLFPGSGYHMPEPGYLNKNTTVEEMRIYREITRTITHDLSFFSPGVTDEPVESNMDFGPYEP